MSRPLDPRPGDRQVSGWAVGGITFAACVLTLVGAFQVIGGLAAILNVITGFGLFSRSAWAGVTAIFLASLRAAWSILVIALDVWVIWSLTRPYAIET